MRYVLLPLSLRNVEHLLHQRGAEVSQEAVRFWWHRFGRMFAAEIRKRRHKGLRRGRRRWHLDKTFLKIGGEVLESLVTKTRDKNGAVNRRSLERHGCRRHSVISSVGSGPDLDVAEGAILDADRGSVLRAD